MNKVTKKFSRKIENFVCDNCGFFVAGTGYTNHCPRCLFSRHVDINPGDRANLCKGPMSPVQIENKRDKYIIVHRCEKCGIFKRNKTSKEDNFEKIIEILGMKADSKL